MQKQPLAAETIFHFCFQPTTSLCTTYKKTNSKIGDSPVNWYWLLDGLRTQSYPIDLANPTKIEQYSGIKHVDDKDDAYYLAELQRLKILPKAHVYDPQLRPVRDLLRRRSSLVHQRTALLLSFKSLYARTTGQALDQKDA